MGRLISMLRSGGPLLSGLRVTATIATVLVIVAIPAVCGATVRIMPLGDSITDGEAGSTDDTGYRRSLYLQLDAAGYEVNFVGSDSSGIPTDFDRNHEGHGGWTANQIRDNINGWLTSTPADIVLLHIGTNDISGGQSAAGVMGEIDQILDNIDTYSADITVFLARIINRSNPMDAKGLETSALNDSLASLAATRIAAGDLIELVDHESALDYPADMDDTVHPNDTGYGKMADTWFDALDSFYGPGVGNLVLTSTSGNGYVSDDLLCQFDLTGDATASSTAWTVDGSPMMAAYLPMEGGASNALLDYSGYGNDGSTMGDPTWNATGGFDGDGYFNFDGDGDYIDLGDCMPTGAYTKTGWYRYDPGNTYNNIISGTSAHAFWVSDYSGYRLTSGHGGTWNQVEDPSLFPTGVWTFCAVTYDPAVDSGKLMLYRNGALVDSATGIAAISGDSRALVGTYDNDCCEAKGDIDDPRIYAFALSRQQIAALCSGGSGDDNTIASEETAIGESWVAHVTPFTASEAGTTAVSSALVVTDDSPYPAQIVSTAVTEATATMAYVYDVEAIGSPAPTFALGVHPTGMAIDDTTGVVDWTPAESDTGSNDVEVIATNASGSDTQAFTIDVAPAPPCPEGMVHYWKLDETSGSTYEDSYGDLEASCSSCPSPVTGTVGGAQSFNASENDEVQIPDDGAFDWGADDSFTVEYWMNTSSSTSGNRVIVGRDGGPTQLHWWIGCDNNGTARFQLKDTSNHGRYIGGIGPTLNDGDWHLIAAVRDDAAGMNIIYVDGAVVDTAYYNYTADFAESVPVNLGYIDLSDNYNYDGLVDEVALYDRALSQSEIQAHYTDGLAGNGYCSETPEPEVPDVSNVVLASDSGNDYTTDDLTVTYDLSAEATTAATAWDLGRAPIMALCLPMEGGAAAALTDYSGAGATVTANGDPSWSATAGHDGHGACVFDGDDDLSAGEAFPTGSSYTKAAWVRRAAGGAGGGYNIISGDENTGGHAFWAPDTYGNKLSAGHNGTWNSVQDGTALALDTWYFVAVTWDDAIDKMILYKNGAIVDSAAVTPDVSDATVSIGSFGYSNGHMWAGVIDDVRIYGRALSRQQIAAMYDSGAGDHDTIVSEETSIGDVWAAHVTAFSAAAAGTTRVSNAVTIVEELTTPECPAEMVSYWKFDEPAGSTYDDYYGDNDATCTNCPTAVPGRVNGGQEFDGSTEGIQVPDDGGWDWGADDSFTVEFWMKSAESSIGENRVIVGRDGGPTSLHWWIGYNTSGKVTFQLRDSAGNGDSCGDAGPSLNDDVWHLITAVRDDADGMNRIYVDGVKVDSLAHNYTADFAESVPTNVGYIDIEPHYYRYPGAIDELALFGTALSPSEIQEHYTAGQGGLPYCQIGQTTPEITSTPVTDATVGVLYSYDVDATGNPAPTYSLNVYPTGMTIDDTTGLIEWTPTGDQEGPNNVEVVASNVARASADTQAFAVDVAAAPTCPSDMTHYWKLNEADGDPYSDSVGSNDATCVSCPFDTVGIVGRAQWFDGTANEVDVPDDDTCEWGANDSFTIEFWMMTDQSTSGNRVIVGRDDAGSDLHWWIGPNGDGYATFQLRDDTGAGNNITAGPVLNDGEWHHIVAVRAASVDRNRLYVDGALADSLTFDYGSGFSGDVPISLGFLNLGGRYRYEGALDEVATYDRALTAAEITDHYDNGLLGYGYCETPPVPPTITSYPDVDAVVGYAYSYDVDATGDPAPTFSLITWPTGMTIVDTTGVISWTPTSDQEGLHPVDVVATNSAGADTQGFEIEVLGRPSCPSEMTHYWTLDEASSPYSDEYGSSDATCTNCPTDTTGLVGNAKWFHGTEEEVDVAYDGTFDWAADASFAIQFWMNTDKSVSGNRVIVGRDDPTDSDLHWWIGPHDTEVACFQLRDSSGAGGAIFAGPQINDGQWHLITAVRAGNVDMNRLYVDGVKVDSLSFDYTSSFIGDVGVNIGYIDMGGGGYYYQGLLDEVAVFDMALEDQQIADYYTRGIAGQGYCEVQNTVPVITSTPVTTGSVGEEYIYGVDATGIPAPTYSLITSPAGMDIVEESGAITWTPAVGDTGLNDVSVVATNIAGADTQDFQIDVAPYNGPIIEGLALASTSGNDYTTDDLTASYTLGGTATTSATAWYVDDAPLAVAHLPMEGGSSNALLDYSGSGNDGVTNGDPTWLSIDGHDGHGCYDFDGSGDNIDLGDIMPQSAYTKAAWINWDGTSGPNNVISGQSKHAFWVNDYSGMRLAGGHNGTWDTVSDPDLFLQDVWTFVAITFDSSVDGGKMLLYKNGAIVDSASGVSLMSPADPRAYVGSFTNGCCYFYGQIDEARIYDIALSRQQIEAMYGEERAYDPNTIVAAETDVGDVWRAEVTGFSASVAGTTSVSNSLTIVAPLTPPVIASTPDTTGVVGILYTYDVEATGYPAPTFSLNVNPTGMVVVDTTGVITWTPAEGDTGLNDVEVVATNAAGSDTQAFRIDVAPAGPCPYLMVGYWRFDETSGPPYEDSYGANDASCSDCPTSVTGQVGRAQQFDGSSNEVQIPDDGSFDWGADDSFTIEFWMRTDDATPSENRVIVGRDGGPTSLHWWIGYQTDGTARFQLQDINGHGRYLGAVGPDINDGDWHHLVCVRDDDAGLNTLYIDAAVVDTGYYHYDAGFDETVPMNVGYLDLSSHHYRYPGEVDELAIYDRALTAVEIGDHYTRGISGEGYCEEEETAPVITSTPVTDGMESRLYTYDVEATGYPAPTFALTVNPVGMTIVDTTGAISWTPTGGDVGLNDVEVVATNSAGADTQTFQIDVAEEPDCPTDIAHYWQFEEAAAPYDDLWGTADATCTNCPSDVGGIVGQAKWFDGSDDEVDVPDDDTFDWGAEDSFTIEFWMMTDESTSGNRVIVGRDAGGGLHWWVGPDGSGIPSFQLRDSSGAGNMFSAGSALNDSTWHHFVAVRDGAADMNRLFVDGALLDSLFYDYLSDFAGTVPINIGYINAGGHYRYHGAIDEVALYDRAVHIEEIQSHYTSGLQGYGYCDVAPAPDAPTMAAEPEFTQGLANTVSWSDESGSGAVGYFAEAGADSLFASVVDTSGWIGGLSHGFSGLSDGELYYFRAKAKSAASVESGWSDAVHSTQDDSPPETSCDDPGAYQTSLTFTLTYAAEDTTSGVQHVELYYQLDGGGYVQYTDGSPFTGGAIEFTAPDEGVYDFYTVGTDNVGNVEDAPGVPDCSTFVDGSVPVVSDVVVENLTLALTNDCVKNGDAVRVTATVVDDDPTFGSGNITADLTGLGGGAAANPATYIDSIATWDVASAVCTPADDTISVTVSAMDAAGNPATPGSDEIISDNTPPTAVTGFDAAAANGRCDLTWTNGTDLHLEGVIVRRGVAGDYPLFTNFAADWPDSLPYFPGDPTIGDPVFEGTGAAASDTLSYRDIHFYQAFCYDIVGLYGPAAESARDFATNYWLGDVSDGWGEWGYDGLVNDFDILKLGDAYGVTDPTGDAAQCDVGPTVHPNGGRLGIPTPDAQVEYEDLMVFAMNYGEVGGTLKGRLSTKRAGGEALVLALDLVGEPSDEAVEFGLTLEGNTGVVKGVSAVIAFEPQGYEFVSARLSDALRTPEANVFFWSDGEDGRVTVDLAALGIGAAITGSGEIAVLTFRATGGGCEIAFEEARVRGVDNEELDVELRAHAGDDVVPREFRLDQNIPNPFNPVTLVHYDVPQATRVTIRVYDVAGRLVRTLVDGATPAGRHAVQWNGRNAEGERVGSGVYFCTMSAADYRSTRKMLLLK